MTTSHGWGDKGLYPKLVIAKWELILNDMHMNTTPICFDTSDSDTPIIIGMDIARYSI